LTKKISRLTGQVLFWLIPTMSLIVTATTGGSLVVAYLPIAAEATPFITTIAGALRPAKDPLASPTAEAELTTASAPSPEPGSAAPQMMAEETKALLARGDALMGMADATSARLFYERAAAAGDAQAALRLAATYDPSFLAQTGLGNVRGGLAAADYWYQRARDLGSDADIASFGQQIESARAAKQVVTVSPAEPVTEPKTTGQAGIQSTSKSVMTGEPTRQAALGVRRRVTGGPRPAYGRHTRIQRPTNGQRCPHSGNCLTPP
jgi:hypothetical protein